ncbi:MAG: hypothetical protein J7L07_09885 [Candidatus Odinarchaeota archaeon]|nr:hypothetical protein [Candidatus Odinarchaeota archaeon]
MSVDFESFLWEVGFGEGIAKRKAKSAFKESMLKLESIQVENNTFVVQLRNLGKNAETVNQISFRKILREPKTVKKFLFKKVIVAEDLVVWST